MVKSILSVLLFSDLTFNMAVATPIEIPDLPCDQVEIPGDKVDEVKAIVDSRREGPLELEAVVAEKQAALHVNSAGIQVLLSAYAL